MTNLRIYKRLFLALALGLVALFVVRPWQNQGQAQASATLGSLTHTSWSLRLGHFLPSHDLAPFNPSEQRALTTGLPNTASESIHGLRVRAYECLLRNIESPTCREAFLQALHYEKDRGTSLKYFTECADREPQNSLCHFAKAMLEMMDGKASRAQEPLQQLLHTAYRSVWADFALGKFYQLIDEKALSSQYFLLACKSGVRFACQQVDSSKTF